jgi:hypothetical protein
MSIHRTAVLSPRKFLLIAGLCGAHALACAFDASIDEPGFTISVPALPAIALAEPRAAPAQATRQLTGGDGTYSIALAIQRADKAISTRECAGSFLRALVARPGMPARDSIYRAPLNERTFLVIYLLDAQGVQTLHAHLLASAASTHCIEAHFSRAKRTGEDDDDWRKSFAGASIVERNR